MIDKSAMMYAYNSQTYIPYLYGDSTVANELKISFNPLQSTLPLIQKMTITRENIQSIERKVSFGFDAYSMTLYNTELDETMKSPFPNVIGAVWFHMSLDVVDH